MKGAYEQSATGPRWLEKGKNVVGSGTSGVDTMYGRLYRYPLILRGTVVFRALWGVALLAVLGGFAVSCSPGESTQTLSERVDRYWELKQAKRWDEVYDSFLDPKTKEDLTREAFLRRRVLAFDILSYTVSEVGEDGEEATVSVTNDAHIPVPAGNEELRMVRRTVVTTDTWVRRDGVWYVSLTA